MCPMSLRTRAALTGVVLLLAAAASAAEARVKPDGRHSLRPPVTGENFYFVMADRFENGDEANDHGGLAPGKTEGTSGWDPTGRGWYHGGDLKGLRDRIDYIQDLGITAIWLTPSFKNKAVQDNAGFPSAGYHGYWITDFTQIDPHLGTNADLRALVNAAHARGMKVYFDIITNHTADVITYAQGAAPPYISKDEAPYRTAAGTPFDDRDYAGTSTFPPLDPVVSFPYTPVNPPDALTPSSQNHKVPGWLNDVTLYHNRGNTTFAGENSWYGDFFGLDDLFTEHPRVVDGMTDIYETWIRDFGVDGFRIDTMKHVNDEFWQAFAPAIQQTARAAGKPDFYAFGEVFDQTKQYTSHFTTQANVQGVLDFPFQLAAQRFAAQSQPAAELGEFFADDDWYTDADSNVYQLPTFLGNHDMGRFGLFVRQGNPGADDAEVVARDRLGHELMYFSRGNPVIYYGDEQGFVGDGGDQLARQDMFESQVAEYNDDDLIGTDATTADSNFDRSHVLYRAIARLADVTREHPALRDGAHQHRYATADGAGIYAFSRLDRSDQHEYVVALNNSESAQTAEIPTWMDSATFLRVYGVGPKAKRSDSAKRLRVTVPPLSAVVYRAAQRLPRSPAAPAVAIAAPAEGGSGFDRIEVRAEVAGDAFYEVSFEAQVGGGEWRAIGTDDTAPYRVFHDVSRSAPGTAVRYRATVLDNDRNQRTSAVRSAQVAPPELRLEAPREDGRVRGEVEVRAVATPELAHYVVRFERQVDGGAWTTVSSDDSSPVYTAFDDTTGLDDGARVAYRAVLTYAPGQTVTSDTRTVTVVSTPVTQATIHYHRTTDSNYEAWGLHLFGAALAPGEGTAEWGDATPFEGSDAFGVFHVVDIADDTKQVGFIVHGRPPNSPDIKDTDADRFFVPLECPHVYVTQGQPEFDCEAQARE